MTPKKLAVALAAGALCLAPAVLLVRSAAIAQHPSSSPVAAPVPGAPSVASDAAVAHAPPRAITSPIDGFDPSHLRRVGGRYVSDLPGGRTAVLTLEPDWQRQVTALLEHHQIPRASVVVMDTDTGRVRVYASRAEPGAGDLARDPTPPAASVFKMVTASALVPHGVTDASVTCVAGGGFRSLRAVDLQANANRDHDCMTLGEAFGRSVNTVFARRALGSLQPDELLRQAHAWGFGESIPFDAAVPAGAMDVPALPLEFARTAAGFWHSHLSPLHGALLAEGVAHGGEMQRPWIVEQVTDAHGAVEATGGPHAWRRAVAPDVALAIGRMFPQSVATGTASHAFHDLAGRPFLADVNVGGKTGTLTGDQPYRAYTWFIGNAASTTATAGAAGAHVSLAVMVANGPLWRVKAATVARQVLQIVYRGRASD